MRATPELVGDGRPALGHRHAFIGERPDVIRVHQVGGFCAGAFHHLRQPPGVVQHGAGAQQVAVEGLVGTIGHEQRALQRLQQRFSRRLESE